MNTTAVRRDRAARYAALALLGWSALTGLAVLAERLRSREVIRDAAALQAQVSLELLVIARRWNAGHGGVYVPVTEATPPSPWLAHLPDRDGRTATGRALTLMNPAWMTREILTLADREKKVTGHVTSLWPLRPENLPDAWEHRALERLEKGAGEVTEVVEEGAESRLRAMRPLRVERSCLPCHGGQGYEVGDVRGGIAVSVPLAPLEAIGAADLRRQGWVHGSIWLLGIAAILVAFADHTRRIAAEVAAERHRATAEAELQAARRLEAVGRLSAGVAHDFNNLLAPILTIAGVVRDELPDSSHLRDDLEEIRGAAAKARDLVRALQTLSRKNGAHSERIPMRELVVEGEPVFRSVAGTRLGFVLRVGDEVPVVFADRPLVELAVANLVVNAREGAVIGRTIAMEVGSVTLAGAEATRLRVQEGRHAAVTVAEASVAPNLLADLSRFAPIQGAGGADPGGAGLGMPTIGGIVGQYGGGLVFREAPGQGWIVRLLLPEAPPEDGQVG
jgi:signal transduction histidine kinase